MVLPVCATVEDSSFFRCFLVLAEICAELWLQKHRPFDNRARAIARALLPKMSSYIETCKALFGLEYIKPKHHFMLHLPIQYLTSGRLCDTFTTERKHRLLKQKLTEQKGPLGNPMVLYNVNSVQIQEIKDQKSFLRSFQISPTTAQGPWGKVHLNQPLWFVGSNQAGLLERFYDSEEGLGATIRKASCTTTGMDAPGILAHELCDVRDSIALDTGGFVHVQYWIVQDNHVFMLY